jgi:hypothetical protein
MIQPINDLEQHFDANPEPLSVDSAKNLSSDAIAIGHHLLDRLDTR